MLAWHCPQDSAEVLELLLELILATLKARVGQYPSLVWSAWSNPRLRPREQRHPTAEALEYAPEYYVVLIQQLVNLTGRRNYGH